LTNSGSWSPNDTFAAGLNSFMDTGKGAVGVTSCQDQRLVRTSRSGAAAKWIKENLPDAKIDPPQILECDDVVRFDAEGLPTSTRAGAHLAVRHHIDQSA
jgi:hypothetical protein